MKKNRYSKSTTLELSEPVHAAVRQVDYQLDHIGARALQEDPINLWQVSEVGKLQEEEEAVDPEPSSVLAYQDSVCLKEQITCRQL